MAELRSIVRRDVPDPYSIRLIGAEGGEVIGQVLDISQKGFRLSTGSRFKPGDLLQAMLEYFESSMPRRIQLTAQCIWSEGKETGFSIKEIPLAEEEALDALIDHASGLG